MESDWIKVIPAAILALAACIIAYWQYCLALEKINLDLFDKRFRIYSSAIKMIDTISRYGTISEADYWTLEHRTAIDEINDYINVSESSVFLFNKSMQHFLALLREKAQAVKPFMITHNEEQIKQWIEQFKIERRLLVERFAHYLDYSKYPRRDDGVQFHG